MKFGEVILWVFIFVVGSLIVSFIINPGSFNKVKNNVGNIIRDTTYKEDVKIDLSNCSREQTQITCKELEMVASQQSLSSKDMKEVSCTRWCNLMGTINSGTSEYVTFTCENNYLTCYCK